VVNGSCVIAPPDGHLTKSDDVFDIDKTRRGAHSEALLEFGLGHHDVRSGQRNLTERMERRRYRVGVME
jgi:hypothetical protein